MYTKNILCLHNVYYYYFIMNIDYILNKSIRILLAILLIISIVIISLFAIPPKYVFAAYDVPVSTTTPTKQDIIDNGFPYLNQNNDISYALGSDNTVRISGYKSGTNNFICALTTNRSATIYTINTNGNTISSGNFMYDSSSNSIYYHNLSIFTDSQTDISTDINIYSSKDDMISNYNTIESLEPAGPNQYEGFRLPAGYMVAITGSNVSFDMQTDMPEYSTIKQWAYSTQRYGVESTLPSVTSFDYDYGTRIIWSLYGSTSLLGEGYHAQSSISQSLGNNYLILVNPTYYGSTASIMSADMFNSTVTLLNVSGVDTMRLYSLGTYVGANGITSDISTDSAIKSANIISSGGAFYYDNGDGTYTLIENAPTFGDTSISGDSTGLIAKFKALLENFVSAIENLLVAPVEMIQRLINAASNFFSWLSGLWSWLPDPVSAVLTSVLYVMAVVGALKMLWR